MTHARAEASHPAGQDPEAPSGPDSGPGAPSLSVEEDPGPEWDAFVRDAPGATFCHLSGWHGIMNDVMGGRPAYLAARDPEGTLVGVLPLVEVKSRLFGAYMVSMPYLNYGGPLGTPEARRALAGEAVRRARQAGSDMLELRTRNGRGDGPPAEGMELTGRKITVVLPLPDDPKVLWEDGLRSKVRSQVRKPMKEGLEARVGPDQVEPFYEVFAQHMRDLGTPVLPRALFQRLPGVFGDDVVFSSVYRDGEPVAAGCGFRFGNEFEITWASALREHSRVAPNMLLYWSLMEKAIDDGLGAFNFGRCTPGSGTHRFKGQWGGEDEPLDWAAWSPEGRRATPNPEEGRYALAVRIWSRLPLPVTRVLGPPLARRLP